MKQHTQPDHGFILPGGIRVAASGDPTSPILKRFFEGYDRAFVLPDEREDLAGFAACLALNPTHRHVLGRTHSEWVAVFEDEDGLLLGGANFLATKIDRRDAPAATVALNYVYVEKAARGRGLLRQILSAVRTLASEALALDPAGSPPAIFIEQNDPLRLTPEQYASDTKHAGLDQVDRLAIWARVGARVVDFAYVQPALSTGQQPDDGLIYAAIDYPDDAVDAGVLHDHLESFFAISVLKGEIEPVGGVASRQIAALARRQTPVALLAMENALKRLREGLDTKGFDSFRDLAREAGG